MRYGISGYGSLSAGEYSRRSNTRRSSWRTDERTGLPVYPVTEIPAHEPIARFVADRRPDRTTVLALHAAERAVERAGWHGKDFTVLLGCSRGPTIAWEEAYDTFRGGGPLPVRTSPQTTLGSMAFAVADYFGVESPAAGLSVTCSSGLHAVQHGVALLVSGMAERVLVGGTEAPLTPFTLRQMDALRVYATPTEGDLPPCRPFARPATGMAIGEGAAFLALERINDNHRLELLGIGAARERARSATGITATGEGLQASMRAALAAGGPAPDFVVAHAPGTARGDAAEKNALGEVFGDRMPTVTTAKWATGHTFGASGPLGLTAALEMIEAGTVALPPYESRGRDVAAPRRALVNATGFGGNAVSVLLGRRTD